MVIARQRTIINRATKRTRSRSVGLRMLPSVYMTLRIHACLSYIPASTVESPSLAISLGRGRRVPSLAPSLRSLRSTPRSRLLRGVPHVGVALAHVPTLAATRVAVVRVLVRSELVRGGWSGVRSGDQPSDASGDTWRGQLPGAPSLWGSDDRLSPARRGVGSIAALSLRRPGHGRAGTGSIWCWRMNSRGPGSVGSRIRRGLLKEVGLQEGNT